MNQFAQMIDTRQIEDMIASAGNSRSSLSDVRVYLTDLARTLDKYREQVETKHNNSVYTDAVAKEERLEIIRNTQSFKQLCKLLESYEGANMSIQVNYTITEIEIDLDGNLDAFVNTEGYIDDLIMDQITPFTKDAFMKVVKEASKLLKGHSLTKDEIAELVSEAYSER